MENIKKKYSVIIIAAIMIMAVFCGNAAADDDAFGPAPNSGDCNPDGSGFDQNDWPNEDTPAKGPAPNSGDGVSNGSGF